MRRYIPALFLLVLGAVPFVSACGLIDKLKGGSDADAGDDAAAVTAPIAAVEAGPADTAAPPTAATTAPTPTLTNTALKPVVKGDAAAPVADAGGAKAADGGAAPAPTPTPTFPNLQFDAGGFPKLPGFPDGGLKFPGQK